MAEMKDQSVQYFLDELASRNATPGGGSAAALMGAQAAALLSMVCRLTIGKPKYAAFETDMQLALAQAEQLRVSLTDMIKADIEVFNRLMACYALPKATDEEKAMRNMRIQIVLKDAIEVPLNCARACAEVLALSEIVASKGSVAVISDAGVAVMSAYAGFKSAALNVDINAAGLKDKACAMASVQEVERLGLHLEVKANDIYLLVKSRL